MSLRIPATIPEEPAQGPPPEGAPQPGAGPVNDPLLSPFVREDGHAGAPAELEAAPSRFHGIAVMLLVVAVAAGVLFGMRRLGLAARFISMEVKIDYPLDKVGMTGKDHQTLLMDLQSSGHIAQVPLADIQMNPFSWRDLRTISQVASGPDPAELSRQEREARRAQASAAAAKLRLNSVVGGQIPVARISGELVRIGDRVASIFTVAAIEGREVRLTYADMSFTLSLGHP